MEQIKCVCPGIRGACPSPACCPHCTVTLPRLLDKDTAHASLAPALNNRGRVTPAVAQLSPGTCHRSDSCLSLSSPSVCVCLPTHVCAHTTPGPLLPPGSKKLEGTDGTDFVQSCTQEADWGQPFMCANCLVSQSFQSHTFPVAVPKIRSEDIPRVTVPICDSSTQTSL